MTRPSHVRNNKNDISTCHFGHFLVDVHVMQVLQPYYIVYGFECHVHYMQRPLQKMSRGVKVPCPLVADTIPDVTHRSLCKLKFFLHFDI